MSPHSKPSDSQPPTPRLRSGRVPKVTEKAKDHFAAQAKKREAREEKASYMQVAVAIESQAGPERDDNILLGELEPFRAPSPTGDPTADRKHFVKLRTAWLTRALLIQRGLDVREDIAAGEIGLKDLEVYWANHKHSVPLAPLQVNNATKAPGNSTQSKITFGPTTETLKTTTTPSTQKAAGLSLSQASAHSAPTIKAGKKRGRTDSPDSPHVPSSAPNKLRRIDSTATNPPRPRPSYAHSLTPERIPAPRRQINPHSSSQPVRPNVSTPKLPQSQHGTASTPRRSRNEPLKDPQRSKNVDDSDDGDDEQDDSIDEQGNDERDGVRNGEQGGEQRGKQGGKQGGGSVDQRHNDQQAGDRRPRGGNRPDENGVPDNEGHDTDPINGNRHGNEESDTEREGANEDVDEDIDEDVDEDADEEPAIEPPPVDIQDPNKPRLRSFRPIEHRRLIKVVADRVLARVIADGTYSDVIHARKNRHGDRITSLEQYAAEEWDAECRRRHLRKYRLRTIHIKYIRGRVTSWRARVKERIFLELRSTHKLGMKKKQTQSRTKSLLPHAFHSSANSNKHALFTGDILPELVRHAIYVHSRDIGPLFDDLFNPPPIGLIAFVCTIANHVIRLFETGRFRARSLRVPEQAATFRMYHTRLLQMQRNQPTRLSNIRRKVYDACVSSLSMPIAAPESPPLSDREWTPDSEDEYVPRGDGLRDDSGDEINSEMDADEVDAV